MTEPTVPSESVDEIAAIIAKNRAGGSVYMDGSNNPRPSERKLANEIVGIVLAAAAPVLQAQERERTKAGIANEIEDQAQYETFRAQRGMHKAAVIARSFAVPEGEQE